MKINYSSFLQGLLVFAIAVLWASTVPASGQSVSEADPPFPSMRISATPSDGVIVPSDESSVSMTGAGTNPALRRSEVISAAPRGRRVPPPSFLCFEPGVGWKRRDAAKDSSVPSLMRAGAGSSSAATLAPTRAAYKTPPGAEISLCPQEPGFDAVEAANAAVSPKVDDAPALSLDHAALMNIQRGRPQGDGPEHDSENQSSSPEMLSIGSSSPGFLSSLLARSRAHQRVPLSGTSLLQGQSDDLSFQPGLGDSIAGEREKQKQRHDCATASRPDHGRTGLFSTVRDDRCSSRTEDGRYSGPDERNWLGRAKF